MAAGSTLSRRVSEFLGVAVFALALIWSIALVTYDPSDPAWFFNAGATGVAGELHRARGGVPRGTVVPADGLRFRADSRAARRGRLESLLVPSPRCGLHQGYRRGPARRVRDVAAQPRARHREGVGPHAEGGRLPRRLPLGPAGRVLQPNRVDHRHPDAAPALGDSRHAVLVRAPVLVDPRGRARGLDPRVRALPRVARGAAQGEGPPGGRAQADGAESRGGQGDRGARQAREGGGEGPASGRCACSGGGCPGPRGRRRCRDPRRAPGRAGHQPPDAAAPLGQAAGGAAASRARVPDTHRAQARGLHAAAARAARCAEKRAEDRRARADGGSRGCSRRSATSSRWPAASSRSTRAPS